MRKLLALLAALFVLISMASCVRPHNDVDILTTTAPVYTFTAALCAGTDLTVECLITENISCLHDYTLQTSQMRAIEGASLLVISGAGLEESFLDALPADGKMIDPSTGVELLCGNDEHTHSDHGHDHHHEEDPHIWLAPQNAMVMVYNIADGLIGKYPKYQATFEENRKQIIARLEALDIYGKAQLKDIADRELITFHDGFAYLADAFDLHILHAIEEESGREAAASELIHLCNLVDEHQLKAIFVEKSGSISAAEIISAETGTQVYTLDMAMSGDYFTAMYHNIDTLKEALG